MLVILFGPPGAGKGTQAKLLARARGLRHLSTGDLLRAARSADTPVGREAAAYMSIGRLVPDDVVNRLVADALAESNYRNVLFDGYPRTMEQAEWLLDELERNGAGLYAVISLRVPEDDIVRRLSGRRTDRETGTIYHVDFNPPSPDLPAERLVQRDDDLPAAIRRRLEVYAKETAPLEAFFRERERLIEVDGTGEVAEVARRVAGALESVETGRVA